jgi:hypothetical protein
LETSEKRSDLDHDPLTDLMIVEKLVAQILKSSHCDKAAQQRSTQDLNATQNDRYSEV